MDRNYIDRLIEFGYADEAAVVAETVFDGQKAALCINGELVSLVSGDPPQKLFKDSIDRLRNVKVKSGLFKKTLSFTHNDTDYSFVVKTGKNVLEYFKLLSDE